MFSLCMCVSLAKGNQNTKTGVSRGGVPPKAWIEGSMKNKGGKCNFPGQGTGSSRVQLEVRHTQPVPQTEAPVTVVHARQQFLWKSEI